MTNPILLSAYIVQPPVYSNQISSIYVAQQATTAVQHTQIPMPYGNPVCTFDIHFNLTPFPGGPLAGIPVGPYQNLNDVKTAVSSFTGWPCH